MLRPGGSDTLGLGDIAGIISLGAAIEWSGLFYRDCLICVSATHVPEPWLPPATTPDALRRGAAWNPGPRQARKEYRQEDNSERAQWLRASPHRRDAGAT